ncbi:hypothetical protein [Massilia timonae]|uniref:hypothetical protein n=1 Tax=Massilia timonae TaxID=47229 RepID=UPI0028D5219B|nr:hypothetical protein [Massilia timonae]
MIDYAKANLRAGGDRRIQLVRACVVVVLSIERLTTARLGADAPPISRLRETLLGMERALLELTVTREPDAVPQQDPAQTRGTDDTAQPKNAGLLRSSHRTKYRQPTPRSRTRQTSSAGESRRSARPPGSMNPVAQSA